MLSDELLAEIREIPSVDVHSHLYRDHMNAHELGRVMFYHMLDYPLRAAGADENLLWPPNDKGWGGGFHGMGRPWEEWIRAFPQAENVSFAWILKTILRDLYDFDEPVTAESLPRLQSAFTARVADKSFAQSVLQRAKVDRVLTSAYRVPPLADGQADPRLRMTLEMGAFSNAHENSPTRRRFEWLEQKMGLKFGTLREAQDSIDKYYDQFDWSDKHGFVNWVSALADFRPTDAATIDAILADVHAGKTIAPQASALLEAAMIRCTCNAIRGKTKVYQLVYGTQFPTGGQAHGIARSNENFATGLAHLLYEYGDLHFNILSGYEPHEPILCSLCLAYSNISLGGFWWGMFYPSVMHAAWSRRLDMVPTTRLMGFFSDAYCIDWMYGRLRMTQRVLANVLAEKIDQGFYTRKQALKVAADILYDTPRSVMLANEVVPITAEQFAPWPR